MQRTVKWFAIGMLSRGVSGESPVCYAMELGLLSAGESIERHKQVSEMVVWVGRWYERPHP